MQGRVSNPRCRSRWALAYAMADMGFRTGVEIGVQRGASAEIWCTANPGLQLTGIDPYVEYRNRRGEDERDVAHAEACKCLARFGATVIRDFSTSVVSQFDDGSLDFLHIDGDHSFDACMIDMVQWVPKVKAGGIVAVHDYSASNWNGVTQAVNAYLFAHGINPWYVAYDTTPSAFWQRTVA